MSKSGDDQLEKAVCTAIVMPILSPFLGALLFVLLLQQSFVESWLWQWFVVEKFNVQPLAVLHIVGLHLLLGIVRYRPAKTTASDVVGMVGITWISFGVGWAIHTWGM